MSHVKAPQITSPTVSTVLPARKFPGRTVTGWCMIISPVVLAILCFLATDIYKFRGDDFLPAMAANPVRTEIFLNAVPLAIIMLMLAVVGLSGMAAETAPHLARVGGCTALVGLCGPLYFLAIEFSAYQLASPRYLAAGAYMYDQANMVPRISLNITGPAIILGFILLAVATYRAGILSRSRAICLALTALLPIGFIAGVLPVSGVGFVACAVAVFPLGLRLLRAGRFPDGLVADLAP